MWRPFKKQQPSQTPTQSTLPTNLPQFSVSYRDGEIECINIWPNYTSSHGLSMSFARGNELFDRMREYYSALTGWRTEGDYIKTYTPIQPSTTMEEILETVSVVQQEITDMMDDLEWFRALMYDQDLANKPYVEDSIRRALPFYTTGKSSGVKEGK